MCIRDRFTAGALALVVGGFTCAVVGLALARAAGDVAAGARAER